jgi:hypothetical protein
MERGEKIFERDLGFGFERFSAFDHAAFVSKIARGTFVFSHGEFRTGIRHTIQAENFHSH